MCLFAGRLLVLVQLGPGIDAPGSVRGLRLKNALAMEGRKGPKLRRALKTRLADSHSAWTMASIFVVPIIVIQDRAIIQLDQCVPAPVSGQKLEGLEVMTERKPIEDSLEALPLD